ncbi:hypothetical protein FOL47_003945 [Perkinsus chesapeaki]|uniref:Mitofilin n=1 Tax=Perkinsus chesapeaki TaxID=330153 RepID=A0A7J6M586_PERCH|nr:hypothetical protein FOL47_003945 [Perkinsus chesapeaki]
MTSSSTNAIRLSRYLLEEATRTSAQKTAGAAASVEAARQAASKPRWGPRFVALSAAAGVGAGFYINNNIDDFPEMKRFLGKIEKGDTNTAVEKAVSEAESVGAKSSDPSLAEALKVVPVEAGKSSESLSSAQPKEGENLSSSQPEEENLSSAQPEEEGNLSSAQPVEEGNLSSAQPKEEENLSSAQEGSGSTGEESADVANDVKISDKLRTAENSSDEGVLPGEEMSLSSWEEKLPIEEIQLGGHQEQKENLPSAKDTISSEGEQDQASEVTASESEPRLSEDYEPDKDSATAEDTPDPTTKEGAMEIERRECQNLSTEELVDRLVEITGRRFDDATDAAERITVAAAEASEKARAHYEEELNTVTDEMADMKMDFAERLDSIMSEHAGDVAGLKGEVAALEVALNSLDEDKHAAMDVAFASQSALSLSMDLMHDKGDVRDTIAKFADLPSIRNETKAVVLDTLPSPLPPVYSAGALKVRFERQLPRLVTSAFMPEKPTMMSTMLARVFASLYRLDRRDADEMKKEGADGAPEEFYRTSLLPFTDPTSKNLNSITRAARSLDRGDLVGAVAHLKDTTGETRTEVDEWLKEASEIGRYDTLS